MLQADDEVKKPKLSGPIKTSSKPVSKPYTRGSSISTRQRNKGTEEPQTDSADKRIEEAYIAPNSILQRIESKSTPEFEIASLVDLRSHPSVDITPDTMPPAKEPDTLATGRIIKLLRDEGIKPTESSIVSVWDTIKEQVDQDKLVLTTNICALLYKTGYIDRGTQQDINNAGYVTKQLPEVLAGLQAVSTTLTEATLKYESMLGSLYKKWVPSEMTYTEIQNMALTAHGEKSVGERLKVLMNYASDTLGYENVYTDMSNPSTMNVTINFLKTLDPLAAAVICMVGKSSGEPAVMQRVATDREKFQLLQKSLMG